MKNGGSFHSFLYVYQMVYFGIEEARLADPPHPTPPASPGGVAGKHHLTQWGIFAMITRG